MSDSRDQALRRMLVEKASSASRPFPLVPIVGSLAIVVTVAIAVAGLVGVRFAEPIPASLPTPSYVLRIPSAIEDDVSVIGEPSIVVSEEAAVLDLGRAPLGATMVAIAMYCLEPGPYSIWTTAGHGMGGDCVGEPGGGSGSYVEVDLDEGFQIEITTTGGRYAVWAAWVDRPVPPQPSDAQQAALADEVVTREEYLAAFDAYAACVEDLGFEVYPGRRDSEVLLYSIEPGSGDSAAAADCYLEHFGEVDREWQIAHAD